MPLLITAAGSLRSRIYQSTTTRVSYYRIGPAALLIASSTFSPYKPDVFKFATWLLARDYPDELEQISQDAISLCLRLPGRVRASLATALSLTD